MLILYLVTLLNFLIRLSSFCMESLEFSICSILSSAYTDNFTFSHLIWINFLTFFFFLISLLWPGLLILCWIQVVGVGVPVVAQWLTRLVPMKTWVQSLALLSGLRICYCYELLCRSQTQLRSSIAVAVV